MPRLVVIMVCAVVTAGCAIKQTSAPGGEPLKVPVPQQAAAASREGEKPKKDGSTIRCREEPVTDSRLRKNKVCMTEDAWASRGDKARAAWDEMRSPATGVSQENPTGGN